METSTRNTGIAAIGQMSWGTHGCLFYETQQDLLDILVPYFQAGLENHGIDEADVNPAPRIFFAAPTPTQTRSLQRWRRRVTRRTVAAGPPGWPAAGPRL
jgi:hypothetical protein